MKREALGLATKRAFKAARRKGKPITWQQARHLGGRWCVRMWPDFFEEAS